VTAIDTSRFRVEPHAGVSLGEWDPDTDDGLSKSELESLAEELNERLEDLQELLYAEGKNLLTTSSGGYTTRLPGLARLWCSTEAATRMC